MTYVNYMEAVFAPAERAYKRGITHETFGHLRPASETVYTGWILFTHTCCGDITIIDYDFLDPDGKELRCSPWIHEHITEFIGNKVLPPRAIKARLPAGKIYRFVGTYRCAADRPESRGSHFMYEGRGIFRGRIARIPVKTTRKP